MYNEEGWIKIYRKIQDSFIWDLEKYSKGQAWIDLILMANQADSTVLFGGKFITLKSGQFLTSMQKLSRKWRWDRRTVRKFLKILVDEDMICLRSNNRNTLITINNYNIYQEFQNNGCSVNERFADSEREHNSKTKNKVVKSEDDAEDDLELFFESIWNLYPVKKGKGKISKTKKQVLKRIGYEEIKRCVDRYLEDNKSASNKYLMHGSTFFNSGYIDYLDKNWNSSIDNNENISDSKLSKLALEMITRQ